MRHTDGPKATPSPQLPRALVSNLYAKYTIVIASQTLNHVCARRLYTKCIPILCIFSETNKHLNLLAVKMAMAIKS